ncbi:gluconate 2-dehydrogenase subunit 3 family protein [Salinicoccus hispanicus]|uniref:Twin-arginine translocation signal domain-containing protein n=1 Tax=Salinicoccus hispanicus TaxID=157225 RepID=A0A6N8TYE4_9STAP|nr:gluconate 2-dehydrogenase subunit 3 family protein [Salinicoccus hispanicus]MXQ51008.1 twin-arginine translocation signal domain-containing protein [Salinicoccus hispanicus]
MDNNERKGKEHKEKTFSRRDFLKTSGVAAGGIVGGSLLGGLVGMEHGSNNAQQPESATGSDGAEGGQTAQAETYDARTFFSRSEDFETLAAATERIYPEDDNGPGAIALGVPYFIDKQLYGFWGANGTDYKMGPFRPMASDTHGRQEKLNRGDMFLLGIRRLQEVSQEEHDEAFHNLDEETQDELLKMFESGDVEVPGMRAEAFFSLLRNTTIEGVYADPAYGGNKDMQGWKMIEYPGPRMGWTNDIQSEEFQSLEPESLRSYQGGGV